MYLKENGVGLIKMAQNWVQWWNFVITIMNLQDPKQLLMFQARPCTVDTGLDSYWIRHGKCSKICLL